MYRDFEDSYIDFDNNECCGNPLRGCDPCPPVKKLTFEEWWESWLNCCFHNSPVSPKEMATIVWQAAQENK